MREYRYEPTQNLLKVHGVTREDLVDLEARVEKALKRQAEDIAIDVTELEKQIKGVQMQQHVEVGF
jgi:hypothetical protein